MKVKGTIGTPPPRTVIATHSRLKPFLAGGASLAVLPSIGLLFPLQAEEAAPVPRRAGSGLTPNGRPGAVRAAINLP
jgi:hypothetical protein